MRGRRRTVRNADSSCIVWRFTLVAGSASPAVLLHPILFRKRRSSNTAPAFKTSKKANANVPKEKLPI